MGHLSFPPIDNAETKKKSRTELQIILLLEILALTKDKKPLELEKASKKKQKSKKKSSSKREAKGSAAPDPNVTLDLLLDRLCIWRSIGPVASPETERPKSSHNKGEDDRLRNFCMEVVMPFYASRLPELCAVIQKKIGGSNVHPASTKKTPNDAKRRKVPTLARSKTAPAVTSTSRNSTPAELIDLSKTRRKNVDLGAVAKKTLQKREVQMPSLKEKPVSVEDELKDAIKALSKPNRVAVGAEIMDAVTRRLSGGPGSVRSTFSFLCSLLKQTTNRVFRNEKTHPESQCK